MKKLKYTGQIVGKDGFNCIASGTLDECLEWLAKHGCDTYTITPCGTYLGREDSGKV